ncbi:MAG TPA: amidohydrolase, partial [Vicinamibacterales bacterium]|nr:amidohydrolase [Vicinamibacterales bacterium]
GTVACGGRAEEPAPDLIITNARVWTVDPARPEARAVAVRGDRIVAVGAEDEVRKLRGSATRVIDAGGRFLMPGFHDSHIHLMTGGHQLDAVDLKDAPTPEEFARRIGERARTTPAGEWILGGNWDEQAWRGAPLPTRQMIDAVTPHTPVFVNRYDEHMALANTAALRLAGVTAATPDVPGGQIVRDAGGEPTGILKDAAMAYVQKVIPEDTPEQRLRILQRALGHMATLGVTSVQDMGPSPEEVALYASLADKGELTTRVRAVPAEVPLARALAAGAPTSPVKKSPFLTVSGAKGFADGSLGSTTAFFFEPYTDDPTSRGLLADEMQPIEEMRARLVALDKAGEQLCIHAIGDRAISMVLDLFGDVARANGPRDRRPRIEHSQHLAPADFARYAAMGAIASVQPYHAIDDGKWAERRIGAARLKTTYAFRSFLDHGVRLAIGTDWPVAPLDPMLALYAGVTRATLDGQHPGGWVPEQKLTVAEVIEGYTMGAAYAAFEEAEKGSISVGKLADVVLLDRDPFAVAPEALRDIRVALTVVGGKITYDAGSR